MGCSLILRIDNFRRDLNHVVILTRSRKPDHRVLRQLLPLRRNTPIRSFNVDSINVEPHPKHSKALAGNQSRTAPNEWIKHK